MIVSARGGGGLASPTERRRGLDFDMNARCSASSLALLDSVLDIANMIAAPAAAPRAVPINVFVGKSDFAEAVLVREMPGLGASDQTDLDVDDARSSAVCILDFVWEALEANEPLDIIDSAADWASSWTGL